METVKDTKIKQVMIYPNPTVEVITEWTKETETVFPSGLWCDS